MAGARGAGFGYPLAGAAAARLSGRREQSASGPCGAEAGYNPAPRRSGLERGRAGWFALALVLLLGLLPFAPAQAARRHRLTARAKAHRLAEMRARKLAAEAKAHRLAAERKAHEPAAKAKETKPAAAAPTRATPKRPPPPLPSTGAKLNAELAPSHLPTLQLDRLIEIALTNNQDLQAQRNLIAAAQAKVPQAKALPDPMVGPMLSNALRPDVGIGLEAKQMIPGAGKLRLAGDAAELRAQRAVTDYTERAYQVVSDVKKAYYDLAFIEKSIAIAQENKSLLGEFVQLAKTKYEVGEGLQQDVLRAQVAQSQILNDLVMLRQQQISAQARLNALLNRAPQAPLGPTAEIVHHSLTLTQAQLEQIALKKRAMLQGMQLMVKESDVMTQMAKRDLHPDYEVDVTAQPGASMGGTGGTDITAGVMLSIPLYHKKKQDEAIKQREAEANAARDSYEAQKTMVISMIRDTLGMLEMDQRQIDLYKNGIIPQAELSLESARAGYQVNKVDFLSLLDSQMTLYNDLREYYRALTDYEKNAAELERTVGTPLEAARQEGKKQDTAAGPRGGEAGKEVTR